MLRAILHEIIGLFVDDGALALALVLWCGAVGATHRVAPAVSMPVLGAALLAGCAAILLGNIRRHASRRG
ncbi:hypothetical protein C8P66_10582 [Humitalea rosea]|uniref:Uncharacterized protein n=1 Tax=Humitalea rosea TaxID=990373 RepID=A0A2W7IN05_9PROT|nr:hypothetical protein [Humitalea rosea]PZW48333.1 hypothetical protein C8P66_10582 [Humitalea rosea]